MSDNNPFTPALAGTVNLTAVATAGGAVGGFAAGGEHKRIVNAGTDIVFIAWGDSTIQASPTTSMPLMPGVIEVFDCGAATNWAVYGAGGVIYATSGHGV
jgi:hypothetical protein